MLFFPYAVWKGDDDHGQICPEGQAEQESSKRIEPSTTSHVGLLGLRVILEEFGV